MWVRGFHTRQRSLARFLVPSVPDRRSIDRVLRLRRPFLYDRYMFVTVDLLSKLEERDFGRSAIAPARMRAALLSYAEVDAAEQESRCGLTIDRVRLPAHEKARI